MQISQFKTCNNCQSLNSTYELINCSIYQLIRNKWLNQTFNTTLYFDKSRYKTLLRLKRLIKKKLLDETYPCSGYEIQDVIGIANSYLYNQNNCPVCDCEDFTNFISSTSTSTSTSTTIID